MNPPAVSFLDLRVQHEALRPELLEAMQHVIDASAFAGGPFVARFEADFAAFCGTSRAVGVGSGTEALWLTLLALGVRPGDEVITVPTTFMATAEAISLCGATPVFVDIDERTYTMNPARIERAITTRTKVILPVHLYGQMADMDPIMEIARRRGLFVVEDACQAHGALYQGRAAGSIGHAGCFSFYPGKNLGALGEAGAIVTNNAALADEVAVLRDHGQAVKYEHTQIGWNARMDGIQAAVLSVKLKRLHERNAARRQLARRYDALLAGVDEIVTPFVADHGLPVYHLYVVRVKHRARVRQQLAAAGVESGIHYPIPIHLQKAYRGLGVGPDSFPIAERCATEVLSLPMYPELSAEQVERVADALRAAVANPSAVAAVA